MKLKVRGKNGGDGARTNERTAALAGTLNLINLENMVVCNAEQYYCKL
jgi:hypothetical protein